MYIIYKYHSLECCLGNNKAVILQCDSKKEHNNLYM